MDLFAVRSDQRGIERSFQPLRCEEDAGEFHVRVPAVYPKLALCPFLAFLLLYEINKLRILNNGTWFEPLQVHLPEKGRHR